MREHFCPVEKVGISFENECNWCGEKEMKTIIEMAREAGAVFPADGSYHKFERHEDLEAFAKLVREEERERIAKWYASEGHMMFPVAIPNAIRGNSMNLNQGAVKTYHEGEPVYVAQPAQPKYRRGDRLICLETEEYCVIHISGTDRQWVKFPDSHIGVYTNEQVAELFELLPKVQPQQEPVGRFAKFTDGIWREVTDGSAGVPLYTTPPQQEQNFNCKSVQARLATAWGYTKVQPQQEPVAWIHSFIEGGISIGKRPADLERHPDRWTALFKDPKPCPTCEALARTVMLDQTSHDAGRTWVGLTDEEAVDCWPGLAMYADCAKFWENIEAKLKEKNT